METTEVNSSVATGWSGKRVELDDGMGWVMRSKKGKVMCSRRTQPKPLSDIRWEDEMEQTDVLLAFFIDGGAGLLNVLLEFVEPPLQTVLISNEIS